MKSCPFCAEEIQDAAIVCKHCGRDILPGPPVPPAPNAPPPSGQSGGAKTNRRFLGWLAAGIGFLMTLSASTVGLGVFVVWFGLVFALPGSVPVRWLGGLVLAIVVSAVGAAVGGRGPTAGSVPPSTTLSRSSSAGEQATSQAPRQTYQLALIAANGYESEHGGYHYVEGQVKNVSDQPLKNVTAVATWLDKNDSFIKSDDALIDYNPILPGQTSPFKTISSGNPAMAKYRVEFKTLMGGTLAVDDQRKK